MDNFERVGYACLAAVALVYLIAMLGGMFAIFPYGLLGLVVLVGVGALLLKVVKERLANKEDDHYSQNVER